MDVSAMRPSTTTQGQMFRARSVLWVPLSRIVSVIEPEGAYGGVIIEGMGAFDVDAHLVPQLLHDITEAERERG